MHDDASVERFPQTLPFARVGSHPQCELRLDGLPPLAYLICVYDGVAESWPLAPLALARSGPLKPGDRLSIDGRRVSVELSEGAGKGNPSLRLPHHMLLDVSAGGKQWQASHRRCVTILGDDHPSMMRIPAAGLRPCHAALISLPAGLWFIDLESPSSVASQSLPLDVPFAVGELTITPRRSTAGNQELAKVTDLSVPETLATDNGVSDLVAGGEESVTHADLFAEDVTHRIVRIGRRKKRLPRIRRALLVLVVIGLSALVLWQIYEAVSDQLPVVIPKP